MPSAQASPYFAALFERWAQRHHDTCERPACVLHVTAPEDVPAAVALLRCCYTGTFEDLVQSGSSAPTLLLAPAGHNKGGTCGIDAASSGPAAAATCWQQLAVRTLVLADRLDVAGVAESCVSALSGRLFAHQMEWECAMAALWLLPEPLAHQQMVAPLRRMAQVRIARVSKRLAGSRKQRASILLTDQALGGAVLASRAPPHATPSAVPFALSKGGT